MNQGETVTREQMRLQKEYKTLVEKQAFKANCKTDRFQDHQRFCLHYPQLKEKAAPLSPEGRGDLAALRTAAAFSPYGDLSLSYEYIVRYCRKRLTN